MYFISCNDHNLQLQMCETRDPGDTSALCCAWWTLLEAHITFLNQLTPKTPTGNDRKMSLLYACLQNTVTRFIYNLNDNIFETIFQWSQQNVFKTNRIASASCFVYRNSGLLIYCMKMQMRSQFDKRIRRPIDRDYQLRDI